MSAGASDKITRTRNGARPNSARVTLSRVSGGTTLTCDDLSGWPTTTGVKFVTYQIDTNDDPVAGTQLDCKGVVTSSTTIGSLAVVDGTDNGNSIGHVVEMLPTADWGDDLATGLLNEHEQVNAYHRLTSNATVTSSKFITAINDTNGNEFFKLTPTGSAVNEFTITNAATGTPPILSATGGDTNIDLKITPKGTGRVVLNGAGAPGVAEIVTSESTSSGTYTDLATVGPAVTVTIGASGIALISIHALLANDTANQIAAMSFAVSGANTVAAADGSAIDYQAYAANARGRYGTTFQYTGLTPGSTTFTMKYRASGNFAIFANRRISVVPL